ncbi:hypothetical protein M2447_001858 [Ereboglobus sp. PH5-10]|nr:hypothetical protein [Ereboglobus sp. PH5-10]
MLFFITQHLDEVFLRAKQCSFPLLQSLFSGLKAAYNHLWKRHFLNGTFKLLNKIDNNNANYVLLRKRATMVPIILWPRGLK